MAENEEVKINAIERLKGLEEEIGIDQFFITMLVYAYENKTGIKFEKEIDPSEAEYAAFRSYIINNYKNMSERVVMGVINLEKNGVSIEFADGKSFNDDVEQEISANIKNWALANGAQKQKGCYVATAVYGSYDCPEVWTLRRYRDYFLATHFFGRVFIKAYYAVAPTLVALFGRNVYFNTFFRDRLDRFTAKLKVAGYSDSAYYDQR